MSALRHAHRQAGVHEPQQLLLSEVSEATERTIVIREVVHRYRHSIGQFLRFGLVGGLGVVVNMAVI